MERKGEKKGGKPAIFPPYSWQIWEEQGCIAVDLIARSRTGSWGEGSFMQHV